MTIFRKAILAACCGGLLAACDAKDQMQTTQSFVVDCDSLKGERYAFSADPWPISSPLPQSVAEALDSLDRHLSPEQKNQLACLDVTRDAVHLGLGLWIRNEWNLYGMGALGTELWGEGFRHPEDASDALAWAYIDKLRGQPASVADEAKRYLN